MSLLGPRRIAAPSSANTEPSDQSNANLRAFSRSKGAYSADNPKQRAEKKIHVPNATSRWDRLRPGKHGSGSDDQGHEKPLLEPGPDDDAPRLLALENGLDHRPNQLSGTDSGSLKSMVVLELDWDTVFAPLLD